MFHGQTFNATPQGTVSWLGSSNVTRYSRLHAPPRTRSSTRSLWAIFAPVHLTSRPATPVTAPPKMRCRICTKSAFVLKFHEARLLGENEQRTREECSIQEVDYVDELDNNAQELTILPWRHVSRTAQKLHSGWRTHCTRPVGVNDTGRYKSQINRRRHYSTNAENVSGTAGHKSRFSGARLHDHLCGDERTQMPACSSLRTGILKKIGNARS